MTSKLYCGLDFHKNTTTICMVDESGKVVELSNVRSDNLVKFLSNRKLEKIGVEASGGTNDLVQKLKNLGFDVRIVNPAKFRAVGFDGKKTDERDARIIAQALRANFIPEVYHKSVDARQLKSLVVGREMIVRSRCNMTNHIRGTLREYGLVIPAGKESFFKHASGTIEKIECGFLKDHLFDLLARVIDLFKRQEEIESKLEELAKNDERIKRMRTAPGVGLMTAVMCIAVMDDVSRFKNSKHFASYLGLVPREYSSGEKRRMGSITRSGSEILRRYFIHGARAILTIALSEKSNIAERDSNLSWAVNLKNKIGMNKATVALAHRSSRIIFTMITEERDYIVSPKKQLKKAS